jgi:hypothetical protein
LGIATRHLSTDRFLKRREAIALVRYAGLQKSSPDYCTFIPKGDMSSWTGMVLEFLDGLGRISRLFALRGGLILACVKRG